MFAPLTYLTGAVLVVLALQAGYALLRGKPIDDPMFWTGLVAEGLIVVQLVVGIALSGHGGHGMSAALFIAYLAGLVVALPLAGVWAVAERESRSSSGVILVAGLGLLVMLVRLVQIWNGHG
ncbi:hypothetical protein [Allobranchiibius sp. GilTou38]|uniref:hypothetical protein n=1 Tax=Allobranchiibius sp. GilTou38 TaxID=2815210 RepID=UPI001AA1285C|nr:hypothetical protein [Allobranchiibius sp. GilTou38]MBO1767641.1 hypothetical protein [Allobranchiibius sp. GilTou38]